MVMTAKYKYTRGYFFEDIKNCELCGESTELHPTIGFRLNKGQGLNPGKKTGIAVSVSKCTNCNLIYSNPLPIPYSLQDHYGVPPEQYWTPEYFVLDKDHFSGQIEIVKSLLPFKKGMKALDIGCGIGQTMSSLENNGFYTYGIEPGSFLNCVGRS